MATTTIPWNDGSNDNIYLTYPSASGDQTVEVSSDANTGNARSKVVTFTSGVGNITQQLTVNQEAGEVPGGLISDYVQDGLILHLDGKDKGQTEGLWSNLAGNGSFTNYGTTFNSNHIYFDGSHYLRSTNIGSTFFPTRSTGTIEVVYENEKFGTATSVILIGRGVSRLAAAITSGNSFQYAADNTSSRSYYCPIVTTAKASVSISSARRYENGVSMSLSESKSYLSGINTNYNYIGRKNSGSYFKGKIYSIRMYNRQLTEAEVLQNLSVDNLRFNLGLTL